MGYKKASDILPPTLIEEIQSYIDGESIYIPRRKGKRKNWGTKNSTRARLSLRNKEIQEQYTAGFSIQELAKKYFLSEKSIQAILYKK